MCVPSFKLACFLYAIAYIFLRNMSFLKFTSCYNANFVIMVHFFAHFSLIKKFFVRSQKNVMMYKYYNYTELKAVYS